MGLAAVTLDAAGTLLVLAAPAGVTYARVAARHGVRVDAREVERRLRDALATAPPLAFPGVGADRLAACERGWWLAIVRAALGPRAPAGALEPIFGELYAHYARAEAWRVAPDAPPALSALRERGLGLAVVSNFDSRLVSLVHDLGLAPLVDHVLHSSAVGAAKPDAALFQAATAALAVTPDATLHVGDAVAEDVEGARRAGLGAVLLDRAGRHPPLPPDVVRIASLAELPEVADGHDC